MKAAPMHVDVRRAYSARCRPPLLPTVAVGIAVDCQPPCFTSGSGVQVERRYELASVNSGAGDERTAQQRRRRGRQTPFLCALSTGSLLLPRAKLGAARGARRQLLAEDGQAGGADEPAGGRRASEIYVHSAASSGPLCCPSEDTQSPPQINQSSQSIQSINPVTQSSQSIRSHPRSMGRLWQKQEARKSTRAVPGRRR